MGLYHLLTFVMRPLSPDPPCRGESATFSAAPEALTIEPIGHGVYRYSVMPSATWTVEDLGRILNSIVDRQTQQAENTGTGVSEASAER